MLDLTKRHDVVTLMISSRNAQEWNENCERVKAANGGYPKFWFEAIVQSGILGKAAARFSKS
jgi:hypothetical protein